MNIFKLTSSGQIDFTVLGKKIKESEREFIRIPPKSILMKVKERYGLSEQDIAKAVDKVNKRNNILDQSAFVSTTKSMTYVNSNLNEYITVAVRPNSTLVELDLNHCFLQLLSAFSCELPKDLFDCSQPNYNDFKSDIADFFSYDVKEKEQVERVIDYFGSLDTPMMSFYLHKVIGIFNRKEPLIVLDAFGVEKTIVDAPLLQNLVMPFSSSINTLAYAIADVIERKYTYYNKFAMIHKGKMYYYVRTNKLDVFLNSTFLLDNKKLDIKIEVANNVIYR